MLNALNLVFLAGTMASSITLYSNADVTLAKQVDSAQVVNFHREWWREDGSGKCEYRGVMMPYVQDWQEVIKDGDYSERIVEPNLEKIIGHAVLVSEKICKDKPAQSIFRSGDVTRPFPLLERKQMVYTMELDSKHKDIVPKWYPQVVNRLEAMAANGDEVAKQFLAKARDDVDAISNIIRPIAEPTAATEPVATTPDTQLPNAVPDSAELSTLKNLSPLDSVVVDAPAGSN